MIFVLGLLFSALVWLGSWYNATAHICPVPVLYRIGDVDERFGVTPETIKAAAVSAEAVWETAVGRDLFKYSPDTNFVINLIYDERQQMANTEEEWRMTLDKKLIEHQRLVEELEVMSERYQTAKTSYQTERESYEATLAAYNARVDKYNQAGNLSPEAHERLQAEADKLQQQFVALQSQERALEAMVAELNARGEEGNQLIAAYNAEVVKYNEIFGDSVKFTQGDYTRDRINIYKFTSNDDLIRVLVHEFGHALGLGHVETKGSAMYYLTTERDPTKLSEADLEEFISVCGETLRFSDRVRQVIRTVLINLQTL